MADLDAIRGQIRAGRYPEAERQARELLKVTERLHGVESLESADVLDLLAEAMRRGGRVADPEALGVCLRALDLRKALCPPNDPSIAVSEENLGALYLATGDLSSARGHLERALEIRTTALGPRKPEVARSLLYLGNLEFTSAHDEEARRLVERAIDIQDSTLSADDPARTEALNMLAGIQYERGEYREAGAAYERVLSLQTRTLGNEHPFTASTLYNLGALFSEIGDYSEGKWYLEQALSTMRRVLRPGHPMIARGLTALAMNLEATGDRTRARSLYREALAIQTKAYGPNHLDVAWTLTRLGRLDMERGRFAEARQTLAKAEAIQERSQSADQSDLAWTLSALAKADAHEGALNLALERIRRAMAIEETTLGPRHPDLAPTLAECARIQAMLGDTTLALESALRASRIRAEHLLLTSGGLSERQAMAYAAVGPTGLDVALSLITFPGARGTPASVRQVWDALIQTRTLVLDEMTARHRAALADSADPKTREADEALRGARQRLANLLVRGPGDDAPDRYQGLLRRARLDMERAERELGARSANYRDLVVESHASLNDVFASLPARWGLVAFSSCAAGPGREFVAFVKGANGEPAAIPIGRASAVESLVRRWTDDVLAEISKEGRSSPNAEDACRRSGAALRKVIWDPLVPALGEVEGVLIVPDGALNGVSFGALPASEGRYLEEGRVMFHYVASEHDLLPGRGARIHGSGLLAIGGVDFGAASRPSERGSAGAEGGARDAAQPTDHPASPDADCAGFYDVQFTPLPQSRAEVEEIGADWGDSSQATVITGSAATEEAFKRLAPGKRVLHIATHGFALDPSACLPEARGLRGIGGLESPVRSRPRPALTQQSPLLLSGLALAAANRRSAATPHEEDGILTAEEVSSLDLRGVECAVLSACDTGGTTATRSEGILGLRRAFKSAGVATLVVSLWPVEDEAARLWMRSFYHAKFREGIGTAAAVRVAMLEVLRSRRAQGLSTNPFYWAAFLATGDWR